MSGTVSNILLILLFIVIGGVFAAAEMSLVSLRESQIKGLSGRGKRGAAIASLTRDPNRFLSAVQIGVTLSGFLSAAFGGATLAEDLTPVLEAWGVPRGVAQPLSLVAITLVISYFSIVLGELAAKRLAMQRAESFALSLAPLVNVIARLTRPVIWFLGVSTNVAVRLLGGDPKASREEVSDEELRAMVTSSATLGDEERQIVDEVFAAGQVSLREAMVPRTEVDFLDGHEPAHKAIREVAQGAHSRYPVTGRDVDDILGFLHIRDLFDLDLAERNAPISQLVRPLAALPQSMKILQALSYLQSQNAHLAVVRDEYGGTAGIVTIEDLVEELIGDITDEFDTLGVPPTRPFTRHDVDGLATLEVFGETFGFRLPEGPYDTVAGFVMARLGHLPGVDDTVTADLPATTGGGSERLEFRVTEMDGRRAARIHVSRLGPSPEGGEEQGR